MFFSDKYVRIAGFELEDPLPRLIEDSDELSTKFEETKIIPYASINNKTGDSLRKLLYSLSKLSTTHAGCIKGKIDFGFTGNIRVEKDGLYTEPIEIDNETYIKYINAVKYTEYNSDLLQYLRNVAKQYLILGDVHIELFLYEHEGKYNIKYRHIDTLKNYVIIDSSKKEFHYYPTKDIGDSGEVTPFFPEFKKHLFGYKSILHIKNGSGFYGEPDSLDSLQNQYNEFQLKSYNNKQTDNSFMGMTIIEIEKDNPETDISFDGDEYEGSSGEKVRINKKSYAEKLADNFTNKGKTPQSVVLFERAFGASAMAVHSVPPITNERYFDTMGQINEEDIILSHRWSRRMLGMDVSNGLNSSAYMDEFIIKMNTVIANLQNAIIEPHDKVNDFLFELNGDDELIGLNRRVVNPLAKIFESQLKNNSNVHSSGTSN